MSFLFSRKRAIDQSLEMCVFVPSKRIRMAELEQEEKEEFKEEEKKSADIKQDIGRPIKRPFSEYSSSFQRDEFDQLQTASHQMKRRCDRIDHNTSDIGVISENGPDHEMNSSSMNVPSDVQWFSRDQVIRLLMQQEKLHRNELRQQLKQQQEQRAFMASENMYMEY